MNDTQWSPGPWEIRKPESAFGPLKWVEIASEHSPDWVAKVLIGGVIHGQANANLIAAAPDLYAACEATLEWWLSSDPSSQKTAALIEQIVTALNKARGER